MKTRRRFANFVLILCSLYLLSTIVLRSLQDRDSVRYGRIAVHDAPKNKYPIMIHHGIFPFFSLHKFARDLRERGYNAYSTQVIGAAAVAERSHELMTQIDMVLAETGAAKVHMIAHSMGGLDARYVLAQSGYKEKFASLTTISSPHRGACLAQIVDGLWISPVVYPLASFVTGSIMIGSSPWSVDTRAAAHDLLPKSIEGLGLASWEELSIPVRSYVGLAGSGSDDSLDLTLQYTVPLIDECRGANDGIVSQASARWAEYRGELRADHFALIGRPRPFGEQSRFDAYELHQRLAREILTIEGPGVGSSTAD